MGDDELDLALEQTFPASDPPAFMAGLAIVGCPPPKPYRGSRERSADRGQHRKTKMRADEQPPSKRLRPPG